ncbi:MAG: choice-of-anchor tandem repeat GloVer-containing protein [Candidatus Sulfotelmatobacter sp.]
MTKQTLKHFALALTAALVVIFHTAPAHAQLSQLYAFQYNSETTSDYPDGENPQAELIQGADGNYYTTTYTGGSGSCFGGSQGAIPGCGAVVKITPAGVLSVVYSFPYDSANSTAPDGLYPAAGLLQAPDGNFYGVASLGGTGETCSTGTFGCGTIFKLTPSGTLTVLHSFCGGNGCGSLPTDGSNPLGRLAIGPDGNLYGTTQAGGMNQGVYNAGTIFRISLSGAYQILHLFSGNDGTSDGANPVAGLTLGSDGNFYGTTQFGGTSGFGTIFKMNLAGTVTILQSFAQFDPNGAEPEGALIQASDGNLYGTCYSGGANGWGTVFRISKSGSFTKLYDFTQAAGNPGNLPKAGLIQASDGNLYGTAWEGGSFTEGSIYQVTLAGVVTMQASFDPNGSTGYAPVGALVQGSDGKIYVTAVSGGGTNSSGVPDQGTIDVFDASLPLPKPAILGFIPTSGPIGTKVTIGLGPYIGATVVKFNGTSAVFKVPGSEFISTIVPAGATTGPISVTTPGGTTTSKEKFTVTP